MRKEDWLKEELKDRFEDFDGGLDLDQAWSDLEKARNPKKKRRGLLFFLFGLTALAIILFMLLDLPVQSEENGEVVVKEVETQEETSHFITNSEEATKEGQAATHEVETPIYSSSVEPSKEKIKSTQLLTEVENLHKKISKLSPNRNAQVIVNNQTIRSKIKTSKPVVVVRDVVDNAAHVTSNLLEISMLPLLDLQVLKNPIRKNTASPRIEPIPQRRWKYPAYLGVSFSYGLHNRTLESTDTELNGLNTARIAQERPLDVFSADIFFRRHITEYTFIEFASGYTQSAYLFEDQLISEDERVAGDALLERHTFPDGSEDLFYGEGVEKLIVTRDYNLYHNYRQFDLTARLGRTFDLVPTTQLIISGGMEYARTLHAQGVSFTNDLGMTTHGTLADLGYKTNGVFSGVVNLGLSKQLSESHRAEFSIFAKQNFTNFNSQSEFSDKRGYILGKVSFLKSI